MLCGKHIGILLQIRAVDKLTHSIGNTPKPRGHHKFFPPILGKGDEGVPGSQRHRDNTFHLLGHSEPESLPLHTQTTKIQQPIPYRFSCAKQLPPLNTLPFAAHWGIG
jgi:hypothetical protein